MSVRVDTRPRHKNSPRPAEKNCPAFLQWLRGRECLAKSIHCAGKIEAAHVDYAGDKGVSSKVSDKYAVPLCSFHHRLQHGMGWRPFERACLPAQGLALLAAQDYWRLWPSRLAYERKLEQAK